MIRDKPARVNFSEEVRNTLKEHYAANGNPNGQEKKIIAQETGLTVDQVSQWFINQRRRHGSKEDRQGPDNNENTENKAEVAKEVVPEVKGEKEKPKRKEEPVRSRRKSRVPAPSTSKGRHPKLCTPMSKEGSLTKVVCQCPETTQKEPIDFYNQEEVMSFLSSFIVSEKEDGLDALIWAADLLEFFEKRRDKFARKPFEEVVGLVKEKAHKMACIRRKRSMG